MFENCRKSLISQHCERIEACGQTVLPDRSLLIGQILEENAKGKKSNVTFWVIFKQCVIIKNNNAMYFTLYYRSISSCIVLLSRAFKGKFVIPEFGHFCRRMTEMYNDCKTNESGKVRIAYCINVWWSNVSGNVM